MEQCQYELVNKDGAEKVHKSWKPLLRQVLVCMGVWNAYFSTGLCVGSPTVIIPQLRREANSTDAVSDKMASWMSSTQSFSAIAWFFLPFVSEKIGRKYTFLSVSLVSLVGFVLFYFSSTPEHIIMMQAIQGILLMCQHSISIFIVTEYSSPKYRGVFLTIKSVSVNVGIFTANVVGTFFHWRTIAIVGIISSVYNILTTLFWCESPAWLASKRRYEECATAHKWIKGRSEESLKEMTALIRSCKEYEDSKIIEVKLFTKLHRILRDSAFYKPIILGFGVQSLYHLSGKLICTVYAIDIIKKITSDESAAYMGMLLLDGVTILGMYLGSGLSKYLRRRTLFLGAASGGIMFLFILSLYLFLVKLSVIRENKIASLTCLTIYFLFISVGPIILSSSIYGEIVPLRYRTSGMFFCGVFGTTLMGTSLKTAPLVFLTFGVHGGFLFYAILSSIVIMLLYKYLPETKDKTLQEIEEYFVDKKKNRKNLFL